jgi:putative tryptophan/tyrosine transport system substrate-binding protein
MSRRSEDGREVLHLGARIRKDATVIAMVLAILASAHPVGAQQARVHRLGFISAASSSPMAARDEAFRQGLRALGYVVGQNITIEYRWADGKNERLPGFAAELVNLKLDVIVTHGMAATRAAQQASTTIPIVIAAADDPLAAGLVASLARPGGNITGLSIMTPDLTGKRLELLLNLV